MELTLDLVVKIIALITALVGLYKIANIEAAKPFLEQLFAASAVLIVPFVMLGFLWIGNTAHNLMTSRVSSSQEIDPNAPDAVIMYQISEVFWDQSMRQQALKLVIERAFEARQWDIVVKAAKQLNPTSQTDPILMKAIQTIAGAKDARDAASKPGN